jgi:outer membrane receptor protein involved in Fe transport
MRSSYLLLVLLLLLLPVLVYAQSGDIEGTVTDGETGEGLIGVNVFIEGTNLGAATNIEGHYRILNVPPGRHTIRVTMLGYHPLTVENVRVQIDQTTSLNVEIYETTLELEEVVITAERPIVQRDVSASVGTVEIETIYQMPVQTFEQVLSLQAGIEMGREGIIVRGGSARETKMYIDGLSLDDERSNIPYAAVSLSGLQEVQVQTGGFSAEYGNVRAGLVNIVTRTGDRDRYSGTVIVHYQPAGPKNFGPSIYDPDSYFNRPFTDPDVMWTGTQAGNWDNYTRRQYPSFEGWNSVSERTLEDGDPSTDLTPQQAYRIWQWQRRRDGRIQKPDYVVDIGFGGPLPIISSSLGDMRFYTTYHEERDMFVVPLSRDSYGEKHGQIKLTSNLSSSLHLNVTGLYGEVHSVSPYDWTETPTGRVLRSQSEIADRAGNAPEITYMPGYYSPSSVYRTIIGVKLTHAISQRTYYEVGAQYNENRYKTFKLEDRDTTKNNELWDGYYVDEAPYGYFGYAITSIDGMRLGGWMNLGRDNTKNSTTSLNFGITSQVYRSHQIQTGFQFSYNDYRIRSFTESPSMTTWNREMVYDVFPYRIAVYLQDKMEYGGFIANLGVRLDYTDSNVNWYELDTFDQNLAAGYGNQIEEEVQRNPIDPVWSISPRLGISHPITENSKIYFNYGHFRSEASSSLRFRLQRENNGLITDLGNPALGLEKTVAYELGYEHSILNMMLLRVAAYYRDVTGQPGWVNYLSFDGSVRYRVPDNNFYEDIRGFELTIEKRSGRWLTGFINYTYDVRTSGLFGYTWYYENPQEMRDYLRLNPSQVRSRPIPYARANINFRIPFDFGPEFLGIKILGGWNISLLANWRKGQYETYNPFSIPGLVDNVRWKDFYNIDMRVSRDFRYANFDFRLFLDIQNVFNIKYMNMSGFADIYDYQDYLASLRFSWGEGIYRGNDRIGDYRPSDVKYDPLEPNPDNDPEIAARNQERIDNRSYIDNPNIRSLTFLNPRKITFGIRLNI